MTQLAQHAESSNFTVYFEQGEVGFKPEQVYPCRCGQTHRGPYAIYDHAHHNCFHDDELIVVDRENVGPNYLMCPSCGKTFWVEFYVEDDEREAARFRNPILRWWDWRGPGWWWKRLRGRAGYTAEPPSERPISGDNGDTDG